MTVTGGPRAEPLALALDDIAVSYGRDNALDGFVGYHAESALASLC